MEYRWTMERSAARPIIPFLVAYGASGTMELAGIVDTGSPYCTIPARYLPAGVEWDDLEPFGAVPMLGGPVQFRRWPATVYVEDVPITTTMKVVEDGAGPPVAVLGTELLDHFRVEFDKRAGLFSLRPYGVVVAPLAIEGMTVLEDADRTIRISPVTGIPRATQRPLLPAGDRIDRAIAAVAGRT